MKRFWYKLRYNAEGFRYAFAPVDTQDQEEEYNNVRCACKA